MKKVSKILSLFIILFLILTYSCTEDEYDENLQTEEVSIVEQNYESNGSKLEGYNGPKFEGFDSLPKIVTVASQEVIDQIRADLEESFSKQISYAKNEGNLVAVFRSGNNCSIYSDLIINMDCEDHNPGSHMVDYHGDSEVTWKYKNVILYLCVIPSVYFNTRKDDDYAILNLTANLPSGVSRIARYFDNEDNGNGNWVTYDDQPISGWQGDCYFGSDTRLSFFYYPHNGLIDNPFPYIFQSTYFVLGSFGQYQGWILTDDEDSGNANYLYASIWNGLGWTNSYPSSMTNIIDGGADTKLYFSAVAGY